MPRTSDKERINLLGVPVNPLSSIIKAIESVKREMPDLATQLVGIADFLRVLSDPLEQARIEKSSWEAFRANLASLPISRDVTMLVAGGVLLVVGASLIILGIISALGVALYLTPMAQVYLMLAGAATGMIATCLLVGGQDLKVVSEIKRYVRQYELSSPASGFSNESYTRVPDDRLRVNPCSL